MVLRTSVVVILVMLATIAYAETSGATGPDQLQEKEAQVTALSSAHAKAVQDFMAIVEPGGSFGAVERMADEAKGGANGRGAARLKLQDANSDEWTYIDVDNDTGTIYSYIAANMWCDSTYGIHMPEEFAASEIFERAVPVLSHYGLSVDIRDYRIGRMSEVEPWYVERELRHKGIVCRGSRIEILLAPTSGRIDSVFYQPVRIPDEREEKPRVTKLEALARAEEWFRGHKFVGEYEVVADARSLSKISRV
ncbi:MAG TPA: hypothetical protein PK468_25490, partial [Candidatus Hydrogenedentes bacterium]|nr:hypothetical protein [Candidatus Hydrogenedentota bacterium]